MVSDDCKLLMLYEVRKVVLCSWIDGGSIKVKKKENDSYLLLKFYILFFEVVVL